MAGGGLTPVLLSAPAIVAHVEGQISGTLLALISDSPQGPVARQGAFEIPLPPNAKIPVGTPVRIEIVLQGTQKTIRITPQPNATQPATAAPINSPTTTAAPQRPSVPATAAPTQQTPPTVIASDGAAQSTSHAIRHAAQQLTGVPALIRAAAQLMPNASRAEAPVDRVAAVLNTFPPIAPDIQVIVNAVQVAGQAKVIPQQVVDAFIGMFTRVTAEGSRDWQTLLRQAARATSRSVEGRAAQTITRGQPFAWNPAQPDGDVRAALLWLISNGNFRRLLAERGLEKPIMDAATRMTDRVAGAQILNAHASDQPYLFLELPFMDNDAFKRAQLHIAGDGQGNAVDPNRATVILDLDLSELGPLWIALQIFDGHCLCTVRASEPSTIEALDAESGTLSDALERAGYTGARVTVQAWDGDRTVALGNALGAAPGSMDVSA